jgi:hypothetical protein
VGRVHQVSDLGFTSVGVKKKMTQGWVVYGGMRHAEPQREMFSRSYGTMYLNARANGLTNNNNNKHAYAGIPVIVLHI